MIKHGQWVSDEACWSLIGLQWIISVSNETCWSLVRHVSLQRGISFLDQACWSPMGLQSNKLVSNGFLMVILFSCTSFFIMINGCFFPASCVFFIANYHCLSICWFFGILKKLIVCNQVFWSKKLYFEDRKFNLWL